MSFLGRFGGWALLCLTLSGCGLSFFAQRGPAIVPPLALATSDVRGCGHDALTHLIGKPFPELANYRLPGHLRVLHPGQGVTRDLMPDRLNAQVTESGDILNLFCG